VHVCYSGGALCWHLALGTREFPQWCGEVVRRSSPTMSALVRGSTAAPAPPHAHAHAHAAPRTLYRAWLLMRSCRGPCAASLLHATQHVRSNVPLCRAAAPCLCRAAAQTLYRRCLKAIPNYVADDAVRAYYKMGVLRDVTINTRQPDGDAGTPDAVCCRSHSRWCTPGAGPTCPAAVLARYLRDAAGISSSHHV